MANNRMFLKCAVCDGAIMLGKRMGVGYYRPPTREQMLDFYGMHEASCFEKSLNAGVGADHYVLEYEIEGIL